MSHQQPLERGGGRGRGGRPGRGGDRGNRGQGGNSRGRGNNNREQGINQEESNPGRGNSNGRGNRGGRGQRGGSRSIRSHLHRQMLQDLKPTDELLAIPSTLQGDRVTIENLHYIGSYNWKSEHEPAIIVPGVSLYAFISTPV